MSKPISLMSSYEKLNYSNTKNEEYSNQRYEKSHTSNKKQSS